MAESSRQAQNLLENGDVFEQKYRIVREIGRGGFGMVYLAYQDHMDRHVAIKVLRSDVGQLDSNARQRFNREVKIISKLRHPNTVTIHDYGQSADGSVYMVLEYIEGETVKQILAREGAQGPRRALALTDQMTRSLAEAHRHGVVHRDLKPDNIMVTDLETESDFVKVLDFGIARLLRPDQRDLTSVGLPDGERALIGTPRYMSPEQVRGESLSPASDVYSVGLILYEMLVGQPAVQGDTTMALISQQISPEPLQMDGLRALSPYLAELIRQATAKPVDQRFRDAEAFGAEVDAALRSLGGALPGSTSSRQSGRFSSVDRSGQSLAGLAGPEPAANSHQHHNTIGRDPFGSPAPPHQSTGQTRSENQRRDPSQPAPYDQHQAPMTADASQLGADLPEPPPPSNAFAVPNPSPDGSEAPTSAGQPDAQRRSSIVSALRTAAFSALAAIGLYIAFLVVGTIFGRFLDGDLRFWASASLSLAIPLLTALGGNSRRERFEVVENSGDRIIRVFVGTAIFAFGTAALCSLVMSGTVVFNLRRFPNWFMSDAQRQTEPAKINAKVSLGLSQVVEQATKAIGIYTGQPHRDARLDPSRPSSMPEPANPNLPAPTRPATKALEQKHRPVDGHHKPAPQPSPNTDDSPHGQESNHHDDPGRAKDYIRWE